jgi:hypothetical protein
MQNDFAVTAAVKNRLQLLYKRAHRFNLRFAGSAVKRFPLAPGSAVIVVLKHEVEAFVRLNLIERLSTFLRDDLGFHRIF